MKKALIASVIINLSCLAFASDPDFSDISLDNIKQTETAMPETKQSIVDIVNDVIGDVNINIGNEQTYRSRTTYSFKSKAQKALDEVLNNLRNIKQAQVLDYRIIEAGFDYTFEVRFRSIMKMQTYTSQETFSFESRAREAMLRRVQEFQAMKRSIVAAEATEAGFDYSYSITYLTLEINIPVPFFGNQDKASKICRLTGIREDSCVYKCTNDKTITHPIRRDFNTGAETDIVCPQVIIPK